MLAITTLRFSLDSRGCWNTDRSW